MIPNHGSWNRRHDCAMQNTVTVCIEDPVCPVLQPGLGSTWPIDLMHERKYIIIFYHYMLSMSLDSKSNTFMISSRKIQVLKGFCLSEAIPSLWLSLLLLFSALTVLVFVALIFTILLSFLFSIYHIALVGTSTYEIRQGTEYQGVFFQD